MSTPPIAKWGTVAYTVSADVTQIKSIASLTFRFIHGEIECEQYKQLMDNLVNERTALLVAADASFAKREKAFSNMANKRLYGKTPLEMFVALELVVHLAHTDSPNVAFRTYLERTFMGIFALYQSVGRWVDVSDDCIDKHGPCDIRGNIAGLCNLFSTGFYTKVVAPGGALSFTVTPRRIFEPVRPFAPLTNSRLFDFIKLLFPAASELPRLCRTSFQDKVDKIQTRLDLCYASRMTLRENDTRLTMADAFSVSSLDSNHVNFLSSVMDDLVGDEGAMDVMAAFTIMLHLGTSEEEELEDWEEQEIAITDAVMLPFVTTWMNRARMAF